MTARVALTMRVTQAAAFAEPRDSISHDWLARLGEWDMTPLLVPNHLTAPESYLDRLGADLLVLTGGNDLGVTPERNASETKLLDHALHNGIAVLGVCRGMQLINVHLGGRLAPIDGHVARPLTRSAWTPPGATTTTRKQRSIPFIPRPCRRMVWPRAWSPRRTIGQALSRPSSTKPCRWRRSCCMRNGPAPRPATANWWNG